MTQKTTEIDGPLEIGQKCLVDCILVGDPPVWYPVLTEHIGDFSEELHYHIDQRFIRSAASSTAWSLHEPEILDRQWRVMVCQRNHFTEFTYRNHIQSPWKELHDNLVAKGVVCDLKCKKCPHQGTDLRQMTPIIERGKKVLVCPAHFMAFDAQTGKIRRTFKKK